MTINELYNLPNPNYFFNPYSNEVFSVKQNIILPKIYSVQEFDELVRSNPGQLLTWQIPDDEISTPTQFGIASRYDLVSELGHANFVLQVSERSNPVPEPASFLLLSFSLVALFKRFRK